MSVKSTKKPQSFISKDNFKQLFNHVEKKLKPIRPKANDLVAASKLFLIFFCKIYFAHNLIAVQNKIIGKSIRLRFGILLINLNVLGWSQSNVQLYKRYRIQNCW